MAFSGNGGGFSSRRRGGTGGPSLSEINITPFVDVVLVLLIIFMLTAHVMEFGIEVDVPKVRLEKDSAQELPTISIRKTGDVYLNEKPINIHDLKTEIAQRFGGKTKAVYVRADREVIWDPVAQVLAEVGAAGYQANVVTQPLDTAKGQ
jgi:biopolymer transport protein ExbD